MPKLPKCEIPNRKQWRNIRDDAGGKKGLSKVSIGDALDTFHSALAKASNSDDLAPLKKALTALGTAYKTYTTDVKKLGGHDALLKKVKVITDDIDTFSSALENMDANATNASEAAEKLLKEKITAITDSANDIWLETEKYIERLTAQGNKYLHGVPAGVVPVLAKQLKEAGTKMISHKEHLKTMEKDLVSVMGKLKRDGEGAVVEKLNDDLGKLKKGLNNTNDRVNFCTAKVKEVGTYLKNVIK